MEKAKGTFTPAVFSTSGGMRKEADRLLRRMHDGRANYSSVVSFHKEKVPLRPLEDVRNGLAMRGYKKPTTTAAKIDTLDLDLRTTASSC